MTDELLPWYNRELSYIRKLAADFADRNPKIAARLRLGPDGSQDPHVERLIEAFAYLNARTRHKLEDEFPELTDALLYSIFPHLLAPIPSAFIAEFALGESDYTPSGYSLPAGTGVETEPIQGEPCRFRTCYSVDMYPLEIELAEFQSVPLRAPFPSRSQVPQGVVRICLRSLTEDVRISDLDLDRLRFFVHGAEADVLGLYESVLNNAIDLALAESPTDQSPVSLHPQNLQPVGFADNENLLSYPAQALPGYRLLTEFFAYQSKYHFFELTGLSSNVLQKFDQSMEIYIYVDRVFPGLEQNVTKSTLRLNCTPVVNLFTQRAEPVYLDQTSTDYLVTPDARRPKAAEIVSIESVTGTSVEGEEVHFRPFYSASHEFDASEQQRAYWCHRRISGVAPEGEVDNGTEVELSLVDVEFGRAVRSEWYLDVVAECCNRDLPGRLPFGGGQPRLYLSESQGAIAGISCLTPPSRTRRPARKKAAMWRLVSHLTLNHLSITDGAQGASALREILQLYNVDSNAHYQSMIDGILEVHSKRVTQRIPGDRYGGFCRGIEITVEFEPQQYPQNSLYLFASVLERFFGLYCSINSFTRLIARLRDKDVPFAVWPARAGNKVLI